MDAWSTLSASPLVGEGGFAVTTLLGARAQQALEREALRLHGSGTVSTLERSPDEDSRRGNPARRLASAPAGPALGAFYSSAHVRAALHRLTGLSWIPSGPKGSYSYYCAPGHYLDLHRDIEECDLALITCVHERDTPRNGVSGTLQLWPQRAEERLAAIRANPSAGRRLVRLQPGQSLVILGGIIPHAVGAIEDEHVRITAPLCFRVCACG